MNETSIHSGEQGVTDSSANQLLTLLENTRELDDDLEDIITTAELNVSKYDNNGNSQRAELWRKVASAAREKLPKNSNPNVNDQPATENNELPKTCSKCGFVNRPGANFCGDCGNEFEKTQVTGSITEKPQTKICSKCGTVNRPVANFCGECGTRLG